MVGSLNTVATIAALLLFSGSDAFSLKAYASLARFVNCESTHNTIEDIVLPRNMNTRTRGLFMSGKGEIPTGNSSDTGKDQNSNKAGRFPYSSDTSESSNTASHNWKYGLCAHKIVFEATETVKKMRFCGDLLGSKRKTAFILSKHAYEKWKDEFKAKMNC